MSNALSPSLHYDLVKSSKHKSARELGVNTSETQVSRYQYAFQGAVIIHHLMQSLRMASDETTAQHMCAQTFTCQERKNVSEVQRIKQLIEQECEAMNLALHAYAVTARHEFIGRKYHQLGTYQAQLGQLLGEQAAVEIVIEALENTTR